MKLKLLLLLLICAVIYLITNLNLVAQHTNEPEFIGECIVLQNNTNAKTM